MPGTVKDVAYPHTLTPRQRMILLVVAVGGHGVKHLFNAAFFVLIPEIKVTLGLTNIQVGTLSTVRNIAGGLSNLPAGFVADRFSHARAYTLAAAVIFTGVCAMGLGLVTSYTAAMIASALMVIAITFWHPAAIASLAQHFADRRGFAIGLHGTGGSIGEALGPIIVGSLLVITVWQVILQVSVVPALLIGAIIWLLLNRIPTTKATAYGVGTYLKSMGRLLRNRRLLMVFLFSGGFGGGQSVVLTFLPIYLREDLGFSSVSLGLYLSLVQVAGIGSQPVLGHLSDRLGRKAVLAPGLAILGLSFVGLSLAPAGWPFILVVLVTGVFLFPLMAILLAAASDLVERDVQATTVSMVFGSAVVVSGLSPAVAGLLADAYGVPATFLWAAAILLVTAIIAATGRWQKAEHREP
jgi:MFS family permease